GAPGGALRPHHHVHRHRYGRHRDLGERQPRRRGQLMTTTAPEFPDEVVTHAHVRYVELPRDAGTAALNTHDNGFDHTKPSSFGVGGLRSLGAALDEVEARDDLVAVCLTGKPFILAVGADLKGLPLITTHEQAVAIAKLGHDTFRRLGELSVPSFGLINGAAM